MRKKNLHVRTFFVIIFFSEISSKRHHLDLHWNPARGLISCLYGMFSVSYFQLLKNVKKSSFKSCGKKRCKKMVTFCSVKNSPFLLLNNYCPFGEKVTDFIIKVTINFPCCQKQFYP